MKRLRRFRRGLSVVSDDFGDGLNNLENNGLWFNLG